MCTASLQLKQRTDARSKRPLFARPPPATAKRSRITSRGLSSRERTSCRRARRLAALLAVAQLSLLNKRTRIRKGRYDRDADAFDRLRLQVCP